MGLQPDVMSPILLPRAVIVWVLTRLVLAAVPLMAGQPFGLTPASRAGVVLLCGLLGLIDVRMRGESFLWANLGVRPAWLFTSYAALAIAAELVLWIVL
jgi:hypothetical protein